MVELIAPTLKDVFCDPAAGTCEFLMVAGRISPGHHAELFTDPKMSRHFHHAVSMPSNGCGDAPYRSMNILLYGVEKPSAKEHTVLPQAY